MKLMCGIRPASVASACSGGNAVLSFAIILALPYSVAIDEWCKLAIVESLTMFTSYLKRSPHLQPRQRCS